MPKGKARPEIVARYKACSTAYVQRMYALWDGNGGHLSKKDIEHRFFDDQRSNGKRFSKLVKDHLGIDCEDQHPLVARVIALEARVSELERRLS